MTSEVYTVGQKCTFTQKLSTKRNFQTPSLFFSSTVTEWKEGLCNIKRKHIYAAFKNVSDEGLSGNKWR